MTPEEIAGKITDEWLARTTSIFSLDLAIAEAIAQARAEALQEAAKIVVDAAFGETPTRKHALMQAASAIRSLPGAQE